MRNFRLIFVLSATILGGCAHSPEQKIVAQTSDLIEQQRFEDAHRALAAYVDAHPEATAAKRQLVFVLLATGNTNAARELADKISDDILLRALRHRSPIVRAGAANAFAESPDPRAARALIANLNHPHPVVRTFAAIAVGKTGDRRAVKPLIELLQDASPEVREAAATALGEIGDRRAFGVLVVTMGASPQISSAAFAAVNKMATENDADFLERALRHNNPRVRLNAAIVLARWRPQTAVPVLQGFLNAENEELRARAQKALSELDLFGESP
jgi:HEAT repeat protein